MCKFFAQFLTFIPFEKRLRERKNPWKTKGLNWRAPGDSNARPTA